MTPEEIMYMKNKLNTLREDVTGIKESMSALKIDRQMVVPANAAIPPGIGCKITYDSKGLVLKGEGLSINDIPEIPMQ